MKFNVTKLFSLLVVLTGLVTTTTVHAQEDLLDTVLVDFNRNSPTPLPWNNLTDVKDGSIENMINSGGFGTGYSIVVNDAFNSNNGDGTREPDASLGFPGSATGDSFFGNANERSGVTEPTGGVTLTGLDPEKEYTLEIFASRVDAASSLDRETNYLVTGADSEDQNLKVSNNTDQLVSFTVTPAADSSIQITVAPGPENDTPEQFFYIGVLRLTYANTAPFGEASLRLTSPSDAEYWEVGTTQEITWQATNTGPLLLEYTTNGAGTNRGPWTTIATVQGFDESYSWTVPDDPSYNARVRLRNDIIEDESDQTFVIASDSSECAIVVLGSSTAEGQGANPRDSAWVNLYRNSLDEESSFDVINLGRGGFNTYNILPTGSEIPEDRNTGVDLNRNVTKALSFDPFAIIVNMPSNDAAANIPIGEQLDNLRAIRTAAEAEGVRVYVATTQPRDFTDADKIAYQMAARDSIYAIFGDNAIDFWTDFADDQGQLIDTYDSGDGVHVNNAGHRILFERVAALQLDTMTCDTSTTAIRNVITPLTGVSVFPNPSTEGVVYVEFDAQLTGEAEIRMVDLLGRERYSRSLNLRDGVRRFTVPTTNLSGAQAGEYLLCTVMVRDGDNWKRKTFGVVVR